MRTIFNEKYGIKELQLLDWYIPDESGFDTIVWFHGGELESGSYKAGAELADAALKAGYAFVSVEYSMYPSARYPEYLLDVAQSVSYVQKRLAAAGGEHEMNVDR